MQNQVALAEKACNIFIPCDLFFFVSFHVGERHPTDGMMSCIAMPFFFIQQLCDAEWKKLLLYLAQDILFLFVLTKHNVILFSWF